MATSRAGPSVPKPPVVQPGTGNNILVNPCQRANPAVESIRNVGKEFGDIVPDFQVGRTTAVLFLSLKYHRLHPEYIHQRIEALGQSYNLRILLLQCDITEHQEHIRELTKICLINNLTIMVAWNADEAGQYLSTYKQFEHKPPNLIRERVERTPAAILRAALTGISKVNKTDVETLRTSYGSFANIARASTDQLSQLPGFGPKKVARMKDAFDRPFRNATTSALDFHVTSSRGTRTPPPLTAETTPSASIGKGKVKEGEASGQESSNLRLSGTSQAATVSTARPASPVWDIELDLNSPSPDASEQSTEIEAAAALKRGRDSSPAWDIELDLDEDEIEEAARDTKRARV
ncbi:DNA repair protein rad10 [Artomyces pyxidatus]|uniref:DNA repair protein rad10 n=1 Tax=Artomyces pyxidatus TaxID=48021 RepID=A0ACB8TG46_9AGAM|nr:DNA repair protein rad10 [Artomyces pyxidatus]